jgi:hypothetical protein
VKKMPESMFSVFRINYEIQGDKAMSEWTCFIGAASHEDALNHLAETIGKPFRVITSGMQCRLDDVTKILRSNVIKRYINEVGKLSPESRLEEIAIRESMDKEEKATKLAKRKL